MGLILGLVALLLHGVLVFAGAPLLAGVADAGAARLLGRRGPAVAQPYRALWKLLRKVPPVPDNATELYRVWPYVELAATAVAALLVPSFCFGMAGAGLSDVISFVGLLALARAAGMLAALEAGAGAGGAGAGRVALLGVFSDAALLAALAALALVSHSAAIDGIGLALRAAPLAARPPLLLVLPAVLAVALAGAGRLPLGQAREAMLREYAGRDLALFRYAAMLRLTVWLSLIACVFWPFGMGVAAAPLSWPGGLVLWVAKLAGLVAGLCLLEAVGARMKLFRAPVVLGGAMLLGVLAIVLLGAGG